MQLCNSSLRHWDNAGQHWITTW